MESHFAASYDTARNAFRRLASAAGARCDQWLQQHTGPNQEQLTTDIAILGAQRPRAVVLHLSGVHGVEGYAGSALQCTLLEKPPRLPANTALILVHIVNPFGMAWGRRVNSNNVDLNRNSLPPQESYAGVSDAYVRLNRFLNPAPQQPQRWFGRFLLGASMAIARDGLATLRQAIAGGQYAYPQGIMYGGEQLEQEPAQLFAWLEQHLQSVTSCYVIDMHTGLGRFAGDQLLVAYADSSPAAVRLRRQFGACVTGTSRAAYQIRGSLASAIERLLPAARDKALVHEFGTYSKLHVLHALCEENRRWHDGAADRTALAAASLLRDIFCPTSRRWRANLLRRGRAVVQQALEACEEQP